VNDAGGHRAGDQLLQTIATRLRQAVRGIDTVARIGGDEFLVILTSIDNRENARKVAHKLLEQVRDPIDIEGNAFRVGFSIGIAMIPDDGLEPKGLIEAADVAMYRVKNSGKNGVEFYSERRNRPD
jgi:diguanylate cyclase (GGDEF)-like protein